MSKQLKVGLFVAFGLLLSGMAIFFIGENRRFWDRKVTYGASFADVVGLKPGAPVRMGGVDIGSVTSVGHAPDSSDPRIYVELSVAKSEAVRVREDSVARIVNKGLLGDKMVEVSVGDPKLPEVLPEKMLKTEDPIDFSKYIAKFESIANKTEKTVDNLEHATRALGDVKFSDDLRGTLESMHTVLDGVAHQDGVAHRLIFDPKEAEKFDRALSNMEGITRELLATSADLRDVTNHVKSGPGLAHAMVYDEGLSKSTEGALAEVHKDLEQVRTGNGLLHAFVYGDNDTQHVMSNVNAMSDDLRQVVAGLRAGKGTLGALLVDPSVYEDIKSLVGNVERNQVLRALVRYSIKADESKPHVETPKPAPPPSP